MKEVRVRVVRSARYYRLGIPGDTIRRIWFVLHGYRQLASRFLRPFDVLDNGSRLVVAPEGLSRFYLDLGLARHGADSMVGASWMTREDREAEIEDYVGYLDAVAGEVFGKAPGAGDVPVTLLGFSQGVATACRWALRGRVAPRHLVLWGDLLPPDVAPADLRARGEPPEVSLVAGLVDPLIDLAAVAAERDRLRAAGLSCRLIEYDGGHAIDPVAVAELAGLEGGS